MSGTRFLAAGVLLYCWCLWQRHRHPDAGWRGPTRREWRASAILGHRAARRRHGRRGLGGADDPGPGPPRCCWPPFRLDDHHQPRRRPGTDHGPHCRRPGPGPGWGRVLVNPLAGGAQDLLPSAVALGGALFWGCGSVYAKRAPHPGQPLLASGMEMICAGVPLCLIGAAGGELGRMNAASLVSASGLALGYLIIFGSLLGYSATNGCSTMHPASSPAPMRSSAHSSLSSSAGGCSANRSAVIPCWPPLPSASASASSCFTPEDHQARMKQETAPRNPPAESVPATNRIPRRSRPADDATSSSENKSGSICCCDWPAP